MHRAFMLNKKLFYIVSIVILLLIFLMFKKDKNASSPSSTSGVNIINPKENVNMEELIIEDVKVGEGAEAIDGKKVTVNYLGTLTNGTKFDSSYDRNEPFLFNLGAGEVIKGWDLGVNGMKVGGKRKLTIPSNLGYGVQGAGSLIPPNTTLIFEIELLEVN